MTENNYPINKNILIAVDDSENSRRAVEYVAQMLGGVPGFHATLLHVIPEPEEDFFPTESDRRQWLQEYERKMRRILDEDRQRLINAGFAPDAVDVRSPQRYCPSMAECILAERVSTRYDTIVVGRQGHSRSEEFLFGSISSKIVTHARDCTVWVVR